MVAAISRDVLLIARDWRSRALTLAELKEAGYGVTAVPGIRFARELVERRRIDPPLLIVDVHDDPDASPAAVERLLELAPGIPLILILGSYRTSEWEAVGGRAALVLRRPI